MKDTYLAKGAELEDEDYGEEVTSHHTFDEDDDYFGSYHHPEYVADVDRGYHQEFVREDHYYHNEQQEAQEQENKESPKDSEEAYEMNSMTPKILAHATNMFLDTTVTKFLQNDISVTKFLEKSNDVTVTKFLDTTVTKFLAENDISVTKFLE